jgi:hypothetical protein
MKRLFISAILGCSIVGGGAAIASASPSPNGPGQPNLDCADVSSSPAGFGTTGFANAEAHYAGSDGTHSLAHAQSAGAVSQYDVACFQVSTH